MLSKRHTQNKQKQSMSKQKTNKAYTQFNKTNKLNNTKKGNTEVPPPKKQQTNKDI